MRKRAARRFRPRWDLLDERCLLFGYTPAQITAAYALNAISFTSSSGATVKGDGTGQTIALVEVYHDPNLQASLNTFDSTYNLPPITVNVINQAGTQTDSGWAGEESMDVEWAHAIAPGANIVVVEASPGNSQQSAFTDLMTAVQTASQINGVSVVSMSLGGDEFSGETSQDSIFQTAGVTFIASSGDDGAVEWPAAAPDVLAVGGTSVTINNSGVYQQEFGWAGTGGGLSVGETEPGFQDSVQSTNERSTPDVAFDAAPSTGVATYFIPPTNTNGAGQWGTVGGTSVGAPAWAAILAIVNQGRVLSGQSTLTGATQTLPALYALPTTDFHKVALTPAGGGSTNGAINTAIYNTQVGLGTPIGSALINDLVANSISPPSSSPPSNPTPPAPPTAPPPAPKPPPFTSPTPTAPIGNPLPPVTYSPTPTPTSTTSGGIPATPPPAAAPVAVAVPKKKKPSQKPAKRHPKPVRISRPKTRAKGHHAAKPEH